MSNGTLALLSKIDDLTRPDHSFLDADDECYYGGDYTARAGYSGGPTNQFIYNFKKSVDRRGLPEYRYKEKAIRAAGAVFTKTLDAEFLRTATLVPIPPSKAKTDPLYDDRVLKMLRAIAATPAPDVRELIVQDGNRQQAAHDGDRPGLDALAAIYRINEAVANPPPTRIGVFDDLLVTGASFVAAKRVLQARFPGVPVFGFFLARRAIPNPFADHEDL